MHQNKINGGESLVSIVIVTFNRKDILTALIRSIERQSYSNIEIIVIDDYSSEDINNGLKNNFPYVKYSRCKRRFGPAFARNLGILKSRGKYILFLDSDVEIVNNDMIKNMVNILERNNMIGQLGGEIFMFDGLYFTHGENITFDGKSIAKNIIISDDNINRFFKCDYIPTSNCIIAREKIFNVGGFDPYFVYPGEDKDFGYRCLKKGYINCFTISTNAKHILSSAAGCKTRFYDYYRNKIRFAIKHHGIYMFLIFPIFDSLRYLNVCLVKLILKSRSLQKLFIAKFRQIAFVNGRPKSQSGNHLLAYIKAILWNIQMIKNTARSCEINYLQPKSIGEFMKYADKKKLFKKEIFC